MKTMADEEKNIGQGQAFYWNMQSMFDIVDAPASCNWNSITFYNW